MYYLCSVCCIFCVSKEEIINTGLFVRCVDAPISPIVKYDSDVRLGIFRLCKVKYFLFVSFLLVMKWNIYLLGKNHICQWSVDVIFIYKYFSCILSRLFNSLVLHISYSLFLFHMSPSVSLV